MKSKVRKIGNSAGAIFPAPLLNKLGLRIGDDIIFHEKGNKVFITSSKPKYKLDELLAQCDFDAPLSDDEKLWLDAEPLGNEVI